MRLVKVIVLAASVLVFCSCLQATIEEKLFEYIPLAQDIQSRFFSSDDSDMLIVTVYGGTLQPSLNPLHFSLTKGSDDVSLTIPIRADDNCVIFSFADPLPRGSDYRLTIRSHAIQTGDFARMVTVQAVTSGQMAITENTGFGNTVIRTAGFGNGRFVIAGDAGRMAYSIDGGVRWISVQPGEGLDGNKFVDTIYSIADGNNVFYAVGAGARMSWSNSGINWSGHDIRDQDNRFIRYGEAMFDGLDIFAVAYGGGTSGGRFVAAGEDGRSIFRWDQDVWRWAARIEPPIEINTLAWGDTGGNGVFIAAGNNGSLFWADDGFADGARTLTWNPTNSSFGSLAIHCAAYGNDVFVIGGDGGQMAISFDGMGWTAVESPFGGTGVLSIAFGSGVFVAAGHNGRIAVSDDGTIWELLPINFGFTSDEQITGVATDGRGRFVAVGNRYGDGRSKAISWYQKPATAAVVVIPEIPAGSWQIAANSAAAMSASEIRGLAWNGQTGADSRYIAVGEGRIAFSEDGASWNEITDNKSNWNTGSDHVIFRDVIWGDDQFVAVGYWSNRPNYIGAIAVSDDNGANWMVYNAPVLSQSISGGTLYVDPRVFSVAYNDSIYVAVGERGWSAWSANAIDWTPVWVEPFSELNQQETNQDIMAVVSDGQRFLAGGTRGKLAWSANGTSWGWIANGLLDGEFNDILTLAYGNGRFIAAGTNGNMKIASRGQIGNANNWTAVQSRFFSDINAVVWGGGWYVAVGNSGGMTISGDASLWSAVSQTVWNSNENIFSVVCGSRFITGGVAKIVYSE
ncbi:MAG: hypothetical protein FWG89_05410 [Treponema sp.]|nr:hypothetical protein [Treponema sp.]